MKKKIILRGVLGIPLGITIGCLITIFHSLVWANGNYSPCTPELIAATGSEINAVIVQTLFCALLGISFAAGSVIWEIESWSIVRQTGIYFVVLSVTMMPIAYLSYWMEHSIKGFLSYAGIFVLIFIIIWIIQFAIVKYNVKKMNANLYKAKNNNK